MKRGEIWTVNFGKKYNSKFGKTRPAIVVQNDIANRNIDKVAFKGVTVVPLTTNLTGGTVRIRLPKRGKLEEASEACVNEICTLDQSRFGEFLAVLKDPEMAELNEKLKLHLAI